MSVASHCVRGHTFLPLGESPLVIDLGANDGKFAAAIADLYPDAKLVLVEGDPFLVSRLGARFRHRAGVLLYPGLIGATARAKVAFHLSRIPEGNSIDAGLAASWSPDETRSVEVPMTSLSALLELARVPAVDLLKIDIEGSEYDVIPTIDAELARHIAQITVEFHDFAVPRWRDRTEACIAHLTALGYDHAARGTALRHGSPFFDCHFWHRSGCPAAPEAAPSPSAR